MLYRQTVKRLSDNAELCYLSHITACQMFPDGSYLKRKITERLVLQVWITQFQNEEVFWSIMLNTTLSVNFLDCDVLMDCDAIGPHARLPLLEWSKSCDTNKSYFRKGSVQKKKKNLISNEEVSN